MEALKKKIRSGNIEPVYFFAGPESYIKEELVGLIKAALFPSEEEAAFNTSVIYGPDLNLGELASKASEYPMFTEKRLLVVRQFEKIRRTGSKEQQKHHDEKFAAYLADPAGFTVLVLDTDLADKKELDKPPFRELKPCRTDFPAIRNPDLFATERARAAGWEFEPEALKLLTAYVQPSAREIAHEIEKLILYASSKQQDSIITAADICECVGISKTYNVFELEKALADRNLRLSSGISLMIMDREGQKEGLGSIVRYLTTFFMRLWKLSSPGVQQLPAAEIARILGMFGKQEYFVRNYLGYTKKFTRMQTESAILALRETDAALKGVLPYSDERFLLLRLMQKLLG
ncbi:MAG: DNA polymerase III subunit delta [Chlorobi bacterium]|nr:DNA polymerase III subunit delta [Chlorobiota bacterium]